MSALDLINLAPLMERGRGRPEIAIGLLDGPVATDHPDLGGARIRSVGTRNGAVNEVDQGRAHGTFVAGILSARRSSHAPAICPDCTLLVRPIFFRSTTASETFTSSPEELAEGIVDSAAAGVQVINLSVGLLRPSRHDERRLDDAL